MNRSEAAEILGVSLLDSKDLAKEKYLQKLNIFENSKNQVAATDFETEKNNITRLYQAYLIFIGPVTALTGEFFHNVPKPSVLSGENNSLPTDFLNDSFLNPSNSIDIFSDLGLPRYSFEQLPDNNFSEYSDFRAPDSFRDLTNFNDPSFIVDELKDITGLDSDSIKDTMSEFRRDPLAYVAKLKKDLSNKSNDFKVNTPGQFWAPPNSSELIYSSALNSSTNFRPGVKSAVKKSSKKLYVFFSLIILGIVFIGTAPDFINDLLDNHVTIIETEIPDKSP
jgi:hypothetical protein